MSNQRGSALLISLVIFGIAMVLLIASIFFYYQYKPNDDKQITSAISSKNNSSLIVQDSNVSPNATTYRDTVGVSMSYPQYLKTIKYGEDVTKVGIANRDCCALVLPMTFGDKLLREESYFIFDPTTLKYLDITNSPVKTGATVSTRYNGVFVFYVKTDNVYEDSAAVYAELVAKGYEKILETYNATSSGRMSKTVLNGKPAYLVAGYDVIPEQFYMPDIYFIPIDNEKILILVKGEESPNSFTKQFEEIIQSLTFP